MKNLILHLVDKAYEVNNQTDHLLWVSYSPHTNQLDLDLHLNEHKSKDIFITVIFLNWDEAEDCLQENINELDKLLTGDFNPNDYPPANFNPKFRKLPTTGQHL